MEVKTAKFVHKETNKTQVSLQSPEMLGKLGTEKKTKFVLFVANSTRPVGQVVLEIHSSKIREYLSQMGRWVEVFCPVFVTT